MKDKFMNNSMTQIKFTIEAAVVSNFKTRCARIGVSMTSAVRQFMITSRPSRDVKTNTKTRPMRKKAVSEIINLLNNIMFAEEQYRDDIPEQFVQRYEKADYSCNKLYEALECLEQAFE
jgi:hypothetical protein